MFNEATQKKSKITFDEWHTERRVKSDTIAQLDIGTSQHRNSPKYLIGAHQTRTRAETANKNIIIAIFDKIKLQKYYVEIDSVRYPRDNILVNYEHNDYIEQNIDLKIFFNEPIVEQLISPFIS